MPGTSRGPGCRLASPRPRGGSRALSLHTPAPPAAGHRGTARLAELLAWPESWSGLDQQPSHPGDGKAPNRPLSSASPLRDYERTATCPPGADWGAPPGRSLAGTDQRHSLTSRRGGRDEGAGGDLASQAVSTSPRGKKLQRPIRLLRDGRALPASDSACQNHATASGTRNEPPRRLRPRSPVHARTAAPRLR